ncbi:MAG: methionine--tRNA ligase [Microgenomates group bacterium]
MANKFYITTAIPYVNAAPHVGHALEFVQADTIARIHRLLGEDTRLLSGGDENALKNVQAAEKAGVPLQEFIDKNSKLFENLAKKLHVQFDIFQKGSDKKQHYPASQKLWKLCEHDIYKKSYEGLYCVGCEQYYTKDELNEQGECFEHPGKKLELVKEENYFFKLSLYQQQIIDLITTDAVKIVPETKKNEMLAFLKQPLLDISISRSNERAKNWGVPVPDDDTQRMYVWFDALNIYQSGVGFGWDDASYKKWWPADVHVIGKGITRFHAIYWPAFLLSADLPLPKTILVHGYFTVDGQKMSKTVGNIVDPITLIEKYGAESLRYYFLRELPTFADGDFSERRFKELYNSDLANGLGNLTSRVAKLSGSITYDKQHVSYKIVFTGEYKKAIDEFRLHDAVNFIWEKIKITDKLINDKEPWRLTEIERTPVIKEAVSQIIIIATMLAPFLPETSEKILKQFQESTITSEPPMFPRII